MTTVEQKPTVLFVCVHNAGRSQMAAGFLRELGGDQVMVRSAGSEPGNMLNPTAAEAMAEVGIETVRTIRDDICTRIHDLLTSLSISTTSTEDAS